MDSQIAPKFPRDAVFAPPYSLEPCEYELKEIYHRCAQELAFDPITADAEAFTRLRTRMLPEVDEVMARYEITWHRHPAYNSEQLLHILTLDFRCRIRNVGKIK